MAATPARGTVHESVGHVIAFWCGTFFSVTYTKTGRVSEWGPSFGNWAGRAKACA
jgi:hypothetical protein